MVFLFVAAGLGLGGRRTRRCLKMSTVVSDIGSLRRRSDAFVVGSYNLLAPIYVRPIDLRLGTVQPFAAFEWCSDEVVDWSKRRLALAERVRLLCEACDVVCFQEVEFGNEDWLLSVLRLCGMEVVVKPRPGDLKRIANRNERVLGKRLAVGNLIASRRRAEWTRAISSTSLCAGLGENWVVVNVHLDAQSESKRVETIRRAAEIARVRHGPDLRLVLAGDWNTELCLGSPLRALFDDSQTPKEDDIERERFSGPGAATTAEEWRQLLQSTRQSPTRRRLPLARVETGTTRAGYGDEGTVMTEWAIDHLAYSSKTVVTDCRLATLEADPESIRTGIPNKKEPSDHVPIAAAFLPRMISTQGKTCRAKAAYDELKAEEISDRANTDSERDLLPPLLTTKPKKASPEEVAIIRNHRKLNADFKARLVDRRRAFLEQHYYNEGDDDDTSADWFERFLLASRRRRQAAKNKDEEDEDTTSLERLVEDWVVSGRLQDEL